MPEPLKAFFDKSRVCQIADQLAAAWSDFPRARFIVQATKGLDRLELLDRGRHISQAMAAALPADYPRAIDIILRSLGPRLPATEGNGMGPFHYLPHVIYVAEHGLGHFDESMRAQHALTSRFSCEFSIRFFLEQDQARTLAVLRRWTKDPDEHVRRLVSEGTRPRLPWAGRLRTFQADPSLALPLLEALKDDPSGYVRRSVANHLNDIAKDHPEVVVRTCRAWLRGASPERTRLVHHALRTLVKTGDPDAIHLIGGDHSAEVSVTARISPKRVAIGDSVRVEVTAENRGDADARVVLGLRVHFVKADGGASPKVFRMPTTTIAPGAAATVAKTVSVKQHTTRTHYPGRHKVDVLVNGTPTPAGSFLLTS